jgi:hypothetical protein
MEVGTDAGLLFPQLPLIDENALQSAVAVQKYIGGVVVVQNNRDGPGSGCGRRTGGITEDKKRKNADDDAEKKEPSLHATPP